MERLDRYQMNIAAELVMGMVLVLLLVTCLTQRKHRLLISCFQHNPLPFLCRFFSASLPFLCYAPSKSKAEGA